jgi:hypothetical protein
MGVKVFSYLLKILTNAHFYGLSIRRHYSFFFSFFNRFQSIFQFSLAPSDLDQNKQRQLIVAPFLDRVGCLKELYRTRPVLSFNIIYKGM